MTSFTIAAKLLKDNIIAFAAVVGLLTFSSFLEAISVFSAAPLIDLVTQPNLETPNQITTTILGWMERIGLPISVISVMGVFLVVLIAKNGITAGTKFILTRVHFRLIRQMVVDLFNSFLNARWHFFVSREYGVLGNTLVRHTEKAGLYFEALAELLSAGLRLFFYSCAACFISWELTLVVVLLGGVCLIPFYAIGKSVRLIGTKHTAASNSFQGTIIETLSAAKLILGYGNQHKSLAKLNLSLGPFISTAVQFIMIRMATPLAFEPVSIAIAGSAVYLGLYRFGLALSELYILLYSLRWVLGLGINMVDQRNTLLNNAPALSQIYTLKGEAVAMAQVSGSIKFEHLKEQVEFREVTFSYPGQEDKVLEAVDLVIPRGRMIALVGKSGAGKTTLVDILMGFYEPDHGQVLIDGTPLQELEIKSWRSRIGFVPQDAFLFNMSLRDNLLWSREDATEEQMYQACLQANAVKFIERLPQGYDTLVGERGVRLSGGQRQRIALARALLRQPEILILDEATSALDSYSERLIQEAIERISHQTTIVVIAHRLSTIQKADCIYVIDGGRVVESGSFAELMRRDGNFLEMAQLQGLKSEEELQEQST